MFRSRYFIALFKSSEYLTFISGSMIVVKILVFLCFRCILSGQIQYNQSNTDSTNAQEAKHFDSNLDVLTNLLQALSIEKKTVREQLESIQITLKENNRSCAAEIDRLKKEYVHKRVESCACSSKWIKIYENGPNGEAIFGDRNALIQAALSGSSVKILANGNYQTTLQNLRPVSGHLMAQALFHISLADGKFQNDDYWWFVIASTTGHWYMSRYDVVEHTSRDDNELKYGMEWFIRRPCAMKSVTRILSDGTVASGRVGNVVAAVRNGYPVRITSLKTGYTFAADNLEIHDDHVAAQALWHISQEYSTDHKTFIFQRNAYWYFTLWSTKGSKEVSRWTVGKDESRGRSSDSILSDWFVDPCWTFAFRHSKEGEIIEGNKADLIDAVRNGHKIRVVYNDFAFEPNLVEIEDENVLAVSMDSVSKSSFDNFKEDLNRVWRFVSTNGTIKTIETPDGINSTTDKVSVAWFVDKRKWRTVISNNSYDPSTYKSSTEDLFKYVRNGADVRIKVESLETDEEIYLQPDTIHLSASDNNVAAMHIRELSFKPVWIYTYTSTKHGDSLETSIKTQSKQELVLHRYKREHVIWFICE